MNEIIIRNDENPHSKYRKLLDLIPYGEENAIPMGTLSNLLQLSERETRKQVEQCRISGNIICSCDEGYYIPVTIGELFRYYLHVSGRIKTARDSLYAVKERLVQEEIVLDYYESLFS